MCLRRKSVQPRSGSTRVTLLCRFPYIFPFPPCVGTPKVNASPSLSAENAADRSLKTQLISDVLDVVDLEGRLAGDERR